MKAEEAVLVSLPNKPTVSVDVKQHSTNLTDRVITRFVSPGDEAMKQSHRETVTRHAARLHLGFLGEFPRGLLLCRLFPFWSLSKQLCVPGVLNAHYFVVF